MENKKNILNFLKTGIFIILNNDEKKIVYPNEYASEITGYSKNELINMSLKELFKDPKQFDEINKKIEKKIYPQDMYISFTTKNKEIKYIISTFNELEGISNNDSLILNIFHDITNIYHFNQFYIQ
ncbi:MAG: PAS domain-containing protein [Candidatus Helarchaeota archaeon]